MGDHVLLNLYKLLLSSAFKLLGFLRTSIDSRISLGQRCVSCLRVQMLANSMVCRLLLMSTACLASADNCTSPHLQLPLWSLILLATVLPVWPMYTTPQEQVSSSIGVHRLFVHANRGGNYREELVADLKMPVDMLAKRHEAKIVFNPSDVVVPEIPGMFTSFIAKGVPLFVESRLFEEPQHYAKIMGYDKPIDFKMENVTNSTKPDKT